jgi:hypothetical protein
MIKFSEFLSVIDYLVLRLRNHSILINSKHSKGLLATGIGVPQFQVFTNDINLEKDKILFILDFLARFNNNNETPDGIYYAQTTEGYIVTVKKTKDAQIIQSIALNIRLFNENEQIEFINVVQKASIDIIYFDNEIIHTSLKVSQPFPMIVSNQDRYFEYSKAAIDVIPIKPNTIPIIPSKDAIRNEYESHYKKDINNRDDKEELADSIFVKFKPLYPSLSKQTVKEIGMQIRKELKIKRGRPKGVGNVIKKR